MLRKELRDALRWAPVGLILLTVMIVHTLRQNFFFSNLSNQLYFFSWLCSNVFGLLLGVATFLPDERDAARSFLVHRGVKLENLFWQRVFVGLGVYSATMLTPLIGTALYLLLLGPLHAPVTAWQVLPAGVAVIACSAMYFAGIIVSCRPSRWLGTRLLPLGAGLAVSVTAAASLERVFGWVALICLCVGTIGLVLLALASRFAFIKLPSAIGPAKVKPRSRPLQLVLIFSALLLCSAICLIPVNFQVVRPGVFWLLAYTEDGTPWLMTRKGWDLSAENQDYKPTIAITDSEVGVQGELNSQPTAMSTATLCEPEMLERSWDMPFRLTWMDKLIVSDGAGYLLVYDTVASDSYRLRGIVGRDKITQYGEPRGVPFESPVRILESQSGVYAMDRPARLQTFGVRRTTELPPIHCINNEGLYEVDLAASKISTILDREISLYGTSTAVPDTSATFFAQSNGETTVYRWSSNSPASDKSSVQLSLEPMGVIPANGHDATHSLWFADEKNWTRIDSGNNRGRVNGFHVSRSQDGQIRSYDFQLAQEVSESFQFYKPLEAPVVMSALPAALLAIPTAITLWTNDPAIQLWHLWFLAGQMVITASLACWAGRYRGVSRKHLIGWTVAGAVLGVGTWLAVLAIYPKVVVVGCPRCSKKRKVELTNCEHCHAEWDSPPSEGIEIHEYTRREVSIPQSAAV